MPHSDYAWSTKSKFPFHPKTRVCSFRFEQRDKSTRRQIRQIENLNNFSELSAARRVFQTALK